MWRLALLPLVLQVLMMALALVVSQISYFPDNAKALLDAGLLHSLPHLFTYDYRHPLTPVAVQLLWNLLDFAPVETRVRGSLCHCFVPVGTLVAGLLYHYSMLPDSGVPAASCVDCQFFHLCGAAGESSKQDV